MKQIIKIVFFTLLLISACFFIQGEDQNSQTTIKEKLPNSSVSSIVEELPFVDGNLVRYDYTNLYCHVYLDDLGKYVPRDYESPLYLYAGDSNDGFFAIGEGKYELLEFDGIQPYPARKIMLPDKLFEILEPEIPFVTKNRIYIPYAFDRLAVFDLEHGVQIADIQLPNVMAHLSNVSNFILADEYGGIFFNGAADENGLSYYAAGWEKGEWRKISSKKWGTFGPVIWNGYYIEPVQGDSFLLSLWKIDVKADFLNKEPELLDLGITNIFIPPRLYGADDNGWVYFRVGEAIVRFSIVERRGEWGVVPEEVAPFTGWINVASEGVIYVLGYVSSEFSSPVQMVKCQFPK